MRFRSDSGFIEVQLSEVEAVVDGEKRAFSAPAAVLEGARFPLTLGGAVHEVVVNEGAGGRLHVTVDGYTYRLEAVADSGEGGAAAGGDVEVRTAMPGLIRAVFVKAGDCVQRGARLFILEAMKMENEVHAPAAGTVVEVRCAEGKTVGGGETVVVIGAR